MGKKIHTHSPIVDIAIKNAVRKGVILDGPDISDDLGLVNMERDIVVPHCRPHQRETVYRTALFRIRHEPRDWTYIQYIFHNDGLDTWYNHTHDTLANATGAEVSVKSSMEIERLSNENHGGHITSYGSAFIPAINVDLSTLVDEIATVFRKFGCYDVEKHSKRIMAQNLEYSLKTK